MLWLGRFTATQATFFAARRWGEICIRGLAQRTNSQRLNKCARRCYGKPNLSLLTVFLLSSDSLIRKIRFDVQDARHTKAVTVNYEAETSDSRGPRGHACEGCLPPRAPLRDCRKRRWGVAVVEEASKLTPDLLILDVFIVHP
jgi:hypothetical protein